MIYCTIDGKEAYPATSENIKVTLENQYIKDSGSYTYDVSFPLDIPENRLVFGNVQRMDVRKGIADFETCRLYAGNRLVMSGKGTVTAITPETVKLQIVGGKSKIKYNSKFDNHYIDKIVEWDEDFKAFAESNLAGIKPVVSGQRSWSDGIDHNALLFNPSKAAFLGKEGKFSFDPILNTKDNVYTNAILAFGSDTTAYSHVLVNIGVQPWLMYTLQMVLKAEGYTLERNDFDVYPWNRLVIATAARGTVINGQNYGSYTFYGGLNANSILPHMTVYDFLENVRKMLGGTFVFDDASMKVSFINKNEITDNENAAYEAEDEFSCEHQEDGLKSTETSNVKYAFEDSSDRDWKDVMSDEVLKNYEIKEYSSVAEMNDAAAAMSEGDRYRTIFYVDGDWYIYKGTSGSGGGGGTFGGGSRSSTYNSSDNIKKGSVLAVGFFNPIIRDSESDDYVEIKAIPAVVAVEDRSTADKSTSESYYTEHKTDIVKDAYKEWFVPSIEMGEASVDENYTVYEAMVDGVESSSSDDDAESSDVALPVFFQSKFMIDVTNKKIVPPGEHKAGVAYMPLVYTDYRQLDIFSKDSSFNETLSLSFKSLGLTGKATVTPINSHNEVTIKFVTDEIPDPTKIYIFHNKRYVCSKIEINIKDDGIEREKTGYFYEI